VREPPPDRAKLAELIAVLQGDLDERLQAREESRWTIFHRFAGISQRVELVRLWQAASEDLSEIQRLLDANDEELPKSDALMLKKILVRAKCSGVESIETARQLRFDLRAAVPLFADAAYLRVALASEMMERFKKKFSSVRLEEVKRQLASDAPMSVEGRRVDDVTRRIAVELRAVQRGRASRRRDSHTRMAMRSALLLTTLAILLPLTVAAAIVLALANATTGWSVAVAAILGSLGSVLSGFFKLRDDFDHLNEFRSFNAALLVQPLVGAAAGLVGFLLVRAGVLALPPSRQEPNTWTFGIYGFLVGFSEPFLFGVVRRLTGVSTSPARQSRSRT
jgi:hypothetical protein